MKMVEIAQFQEIYRISMDEMYAGDLNKLPKKSKIIVRLGRFSSTIIACSNNVIVVVFKRTLTMSLSLQTSPKISVKIVTTIGAFWCVSRRCAERKLFIIFSKINCNVDGSLWRAHVINGFDTPFWIGNWNYKYKWAHWFLDIQITLILPIERVESIWRPNQWILFAVEHPIDSLISRCRQQSNAIFGERLESIVSPVFQLITAMAKCNGS